MLRIGPLVVALVSLQGTALADESRPPAPKGAELAACRTAADQPVCLLKLAARGFAHQPYAANIEVGYATDVLAAIGPEPINATTASFVDALAAPGRAAVQALIADRAGASPTQALAPIRAMTASKPTTDEYAAYERIRAYRILWDASHGPSPLPTGRRPSDPLIRAALDAWRSDVPLAGDHGDADELVAAFRAIGDSHGAKSVPLPPKAGVEQVNFLIESGRLDDAARAVEALVRSPTPEHRVEALFERALLVHKAVAAGRQDIALRIARSQLNAWFAEFADTSRPGSAHSGADVSSSLLLIVRFAPRGEAVKWTERMEATARQGPSLAAATSAFAAARAWMRLGEKDRAKAVVRLWPAPSPAEIKGCLVGLFQISAQCQKTPGAVLAIMLAATPPDAAWEELMPLYGAMALDRRKAGRGLAGVEEDLAHAASNEERFRILQTCARASAEEHSVATVAICARRLAAAPAPEAPLKLKTGMLSYDKRRLDAALNAARRAAESQDWKTLREMVDLSFDLAARAPDEPVNSLVDLESIAIAELRQQGRL